MNYSRKDLKADVEFVAIWMFLAFCIGAAGTAGGLFVWWILS